MFAPICFNGFVTRFIGLFAIDSSPCTQEKNGVLANIPDINRIVVPELPTSNTAFGSCKPSNPLPTTVTSSPFCVISTPISLKHEIVLKQSAPGKKPLIVVFPSAIEPNITARCEMDLSPGIVILPFNPLLTGCIVLSFTFFTFSFKLFHKFGILLLQALVLLSYDLLPFGS
ncbi:Uncharacterised protein [Streptococcus pneumoniae]|nr:Uncharacterised protein [Streptococcus pneumoniae]